MSPTHAPRRRLLLLLPLAIFLGLAVWFALGLTRDPSVLPSAMIDRPAPAFTLEPVLDDVPGLATADLATGKPVLVNFFASWCAPCRLEHPLLMRLSAELKVPVLGIAYKDKPEATRGFLAQLGNPYARIGADLSGRTGIDFGVYGVPETYVIDGAGRIRYRHVGPLTAADLDVRLLPLLRDLGKEG